MRRNRVIILKIASVPYVIVVLKQKQPVTFSCVALFLLKNFLQKLHDDVYQIDALIKSLNEESLIDVLIYVSNRYNGSKNKQIILHTICYTQSTKRFERPFIDQYLLCSINTLCFSLLCLLNFYLQCNLLSS